MKKHLIRINAASLILILFTWTIVFAEMRVLVIPKGSMTVFWKKVAQGAKRAGEDCRIKVTVRGPSNDDQHESQIKIIEYGIRQKFDAIVLAPNESHKVVPIVKKAVDRGIRVVLIDSNMNCDCHSSFIESDNYKAGQKAARYAVSLLGDRGHFIIVRFIENNASTHDRERGFVETIKKEAPKIEMTATCFAGASVGSACHTVMDIMDRFSDIDLLFSVNESTTLGTLQALRKKNLLGKAKHIGFDFNDIIKNAILHKEMDATIVQDPFQIGYLGVKNAFHLILNKTVPKKTFTDTVLIDAESYHRTEVQSIISPYLRQQDSN